jgi:hypothetical protein
MTVNLTVTVRMYRPVIPLQTYTLYVFARIEQFESIGDAICAASADYSSCQCTTTSASIRL